MDEFTIELGIIHCAVCPGKPIIGKSEQEWNQHVQNPKHRKFRQKRKDKLIRKAIHLAPVSTAAPGSLDLKPNTAPEASTDSLSSSVVPPVAENANLKRKNSLDSQGDTVMETRQPEETTVSPSTDHPHPMSLHDDMDDAKNASDIMLSAPWIPQQPHYSSNIVDRFNQECHDFVTYLQPSTSEQMVREWLIGRLRRLVHEIWGDPRMRAHDDSVEWADLLCYGSTKTTTFLSTGDINLMIITNVTTQLENEMLQRLKEVLIQRNFGDATGTKRVIVTNAFTPIVRFWEKRTLIKVDICIASPVVVESGEFAAAHLEHERYGRGLRSLLMLLKHFLAQHVLNEQFSGGVGTYLLTLMTVAFFQHHPFLREHPEVNPNDNIGILLLEFLEFYGVKFDWKRYGISVQGDGMLFRRQYNQHQAIRLSLRDPANPSIDIGMKAYRINEVFERFRMMLLTFGTIIDRYSDPNAVQSLTSNTSILAHVFKPSLSGIKMRERLQQFEAKNLAENIGKIVSYRISEHQYVELAREPFGCDNVQYVTESSHLPPLYKPHTWASKRMRYTT